MLRLLSLAVSAAAFLARPAFATEWHVVGARAMGMGGAGVAAADGPVSAYWNPALLGQPESPSGLQVPLDAHAELTGQLLEGANDFHDIANDCQSLGANQGLCTQANINAALTKLNDPANGLRGDAALGAHFKVKRVALFADQQAYLAGIPKVDLANTTPVDIQQGRNNSKLVLRGLAVSELGGGYGMELPFLRGLSVGANLKLLVGKAGYYDLSLAQNSPTSSSIYNKLVNGAKTSVQPGLDLGALWDVRRTFSSVPLRPRIGICSRNINDPKFDNPDQAKLAGEPVQKSLQGNTRLGVALSPLNFWHLAADVDLTRNLTEVDGVASQNFGAGTEVNVFNRSWLNIPLRAGVARNLAQSGAKTSVTGGFGLNFMHFVLDASVMVSPATVQIKSAKEEQKIPSNVSAGLQVAWIIGGGAAAAKD